MSILSIQPVNRRALTSMFMFFSFLCLPLSGVPLHYTRGTDFSTLEHWLMSVHNMAATIFLAATVIHLVLNWRALSKYMVEKTLEFFSLKREMITAFLLVVIIVGVFSSHALHTHHP